MNWVILQVYGKPEIFLEARFLLVSAFGQLMADADVKVCLYTDWPDEIAAWGFPAEKVFIKPLRADTIAAWKGPLDFVHRLKIEMLRDAAVTLRPDKMLYLDSDMVLRGDLEALWHHIGPGKGVMHEDEGRLDSGKNPILQKMHPFVKGRVFQLNPDMPYQVEAHTSMRNAGVLGLAQADFGLLDAVLALTDTMYAQYPKHVIEQLAFSSVLGRQLVLHDATPQFLHYWYAKELREWLDTFFKTLGKKSLEDQATAAANLSVEKVAASRLAWKNKPSWKRKIRSFLGAEWSLPPFPTVLSKKE